MAANGVRTPFLLEPTARVSTAYGTLGKGMHAGLPGHSFVLIDADGTQRWYGEYPSMYLSSGRPARPDPPTPALSTTAPPGLPRLRDGAVPDDRPLGPGIGRSDPTRVAMPAR